MKYPLVLNFTDLGSANIREYFDIREVLRHVLVDSRKIRNF